MLLFVIKNNLYINNRGPFRRCFCWSFCKIVIIWLNSFKLLVTAICLLIREAESTQVVFNHDLWHDPWLPLQLYSTFDYLGTSTCSIRCCRFLASSDQTACIVVAWTTVLSINDYRALYYASVKQSARVCGSCYPSIAESQQLLDRLSSSIQRSPSMT